MVLPSRALGRTGVLVSALSLGTMNFADGTEFDEADRIVGRFRDVGGNLIDSANIYAAGRSEEMLGQVVAAQGCRDNLLIATKLGGRVGRGPNDKGLSRLHVLREAEESLRRLHIDHIDLLQLHRPDDNVPIDETLAALDDLVSTGKVRFVGCSNFPAWTIVEALWASSAKRLVRFVSEQPPYNLLDRRVEQELLPMAQTHGLAIIPWGPLAGGMLSGKYRRDATPPEGSRYTNDRYRGAPIEEPIWRVLEGLESLAATKGVTLSQLALAWVLSRPGVTSPILGARTLEQLEDNLKAAEIEIATVDEAAIDKLIAPGSFVKSYYTMRSSAQ